MPRLATALAAALSVAAPFVVVRVSVPAVIAPDSPSVIVLLAPVVVSETDPEPAFTLLFSASAPLAVNEIPLLLLRPASIVKPAVAVESTVIGVEIRLAAIVAFAAEPYVSARSTFNADIVCLDVVSRFMPDVMAGITTLPALSVWFSE